jgi:transposase InsO family protein
MDLLASIFQWLREEEAGFSAVAAIHIAKDLAAYLQKHGLGHTRGRPYHPMTQGKIECYHRPMKNVVQLENYYTPGELERAIARFVDHYNCERLHEATGNVTPDGHVPRPPARDREPQRENQTLDIGAKEERESTQRSLTANKDRELSPRRAVQLSEKT